MHPVQPYARGAAWHLAIASKQADMLASTGPPAAQVNGRVLANINHALSDTWQARHGIHPDHAADAGRAQMLIERADASARAARDVLTAQDDPAGILRGAAGDAWQAQRLIARIDGDDAPIMTSTLMRNADESDRALVTTAGAAHQADQPFTAARWDVEQLLRGGDDLVTDHVETIGNPLGSNASLERLALTDTRSGWHTHAVRKTTAQQAAQEVYGARLAVEAGLGHRVPAAVRSGDGSAMIEFVDGRPLWEHSIAGPDDLIDALRGEYARAWPAMDDAQLDRAARTEAERIGMFDWLAANPDRHDGNALVEATTGRVVLFDHGFAGQVGGGDPLVPRLRELYVGGAGMLRPDRQAAHEMTSRLMRPGVLEHARLALSQPPFPTDPAERHLLEAAARDADQGVRARVRALAGADELRYRPLGADDNPLVSVPVEGAQVSVRSR